MKGRYRVVVSSRRLRYDFELKRNLTIVRGDSATGKTTLVEMILEYISNPSGSYIVSDGSNKTGLEDITAYCPAGIPARQYTRFVPFMLTVPILLQSLQGAGLLWQALGSILLVLALVRLRYLRGR